MPADHIDEIAHLFGPENKRNEVAEGLRLIKAFMRIHDPARRAEIVAFAESIAGKIHPGHNASLSAGTDTDQSDT